jgi:urate oxidase
MLTLHEINALDEEQFTARLGPLFEGSPWIARETWPARPFASLAALHAALTATVSRADLDRKLALIRAHPDLAGRAAIARELTPESAREQSSAGLDRLTPEEFAAFTRLNGAYGERFGFPFVICVREHDKHGILQQFERRLTNDSEAEVQTALGEIGKIAWLRLRDLAADEAEETVVLGPASYGKSAVRLVKVARGAERHDIWDLNVDIALEGDFAASYTGSDNTRMLATDTMRNAVYALAKSHPLDSIESFALALARHHLQAGPTVTGATARVVEYPWGRIEAGGAPHAHSFVRGAGERVAVVRVTAEGAEVRAGIDNLLILKTTESGWVNFHRDGLTTLPDAADRILATSLTATWTYEPGDHEYTPLWHAVRARILETFTDHYSPSVQNTLYRMGRAVLEAFPAVRSIHFALPNKHHLPFNLAPFGLANDNDIFQVTSDPYGLIEGTVERRGARQ